MHEIQTVGVETELGRFFAAARLRASDYGDHYVALWDCLERASTGGKRVRPALVLAAFSGLGGTDLTLATPVAVSFELLHTAFVIHDDVIDRDLARRGVANIAGTFAERAHAHGAEDQADAWAATAAILAGDLALSEAHRALALLPVELELRGRLLDLLDRAVFVSAAGELADVTNTASKHPLSVDRVVSTLEQKTAVYSFEAPLQAGAVLAGASAEAIDALGAFGRLIGVAFQLTDDILGVFGDPAVTGKSVLTDLREGKQTALIAHAGTTPAWTGIAPFIGKADLTEAEAEAVRASIRDCGALQSATELAADHADRAARALDTPAIPAALRALLTTLAGTAVNRSR
ncbi:polyprenyl synthetase family protein [Cryobacterium sp. TMT2-10]|uniref:Polyprenyl synthetase family protein n=1 Tax=Cryobacterium shii TaxID=1259235 RepID=A0AAQ2C8X3_9MICO|nr:MULTISPECIES: polyprenyl synthetase family protein [Cryobacterium]TFC52075.1 polyprenyl synthetase family protein [Cryobacterium shii]TFD36989.1 polyprenyl synthetase family protein [Cryobacterium sp. TMT2-10]